MNLDNYEEITLNSIEPDSGYWHTATVNCPVQSKFSNGGLGKYWNG